VFSQFAACVNLGGPDDAPPGDRSALAPGEVDLTLPGLPDGPVVPAAGGTMDVFVDIQTGAVFLGGYQLRLNWSPAGPALGLDPTFGGTGSGGDFGVSHDDPGTGLPLSAMDLGPIVVTDNQLGETTFLDASSSMAPVSSGVVRVAVLRFECVAGVGATATITGTIEAVASTDPVPDPTIGAPTPRPLTAGAGSFWLP
jgi:hypothetical protein